MNYCKDCRHYKSTSSEGPYCMSGSRPKPVSSLSSRDCFEERVEAEPEIPVEAAAPVLKHCPKCGRDLPVTEFNRNRRMKDGRQSECRECQSGEQIEHSRNYRKRRVEKAREAEAAAQEAGEKVCRKCGRALPLDRFAKHRGSITGYSHICKECKAEICRKGARATADRRMDYKLKYAPLKLPDKIVNELLEPDALQAAVMDELLVRIPMSLLHGNVELAFSRGKDAFLVEIRRKEETK